MYQKWYQTVLVKWFVNFLYFSFIIFRVVDPGITVLWHRLPCQPTINLNQLSYLKLSHQLKVTLMPKRHILEWHILLPLIHSLWNFPKKFYYLEVELADLFISLNPSVSPERRLIQLSRCPLSFRRQSESWLSKLGLYARSNQIYDKGFPMKMRGLKRL